MSLKIDRVQLEIIVQQDKARQQMMELEGQMRSANKELKSIRKQFGENSKEYRAQQDVIRRLKQQYDDLFNEIGIGRLSLKELTNRQRELNAILRNLDPSLPEWKQYNQQLKEVNARIRELKGTATETGLSIGKLADGFNRYVAIGASAIATLTGMTLTMRKCVDEYASMEEAESQVIKYTGMTTEEVKQLNEEFKAMDTRTPREELNRLAGEAGKLGIIGTQQVKEFVQAADMINVALGEDLGEEAVNQIGKLSQMFGDESRTLKENMLAIGSAVNQVAQSTSASEPYLVSFTARMGGVGKQAKMSVTDIMGFASALDQNMLRSEMASTALSGLIMRIFQEPAKYAKLAGMDVQEFTELVKTDVNEAVMSFLSALNKMGGMSQMALVLKEMQLSGAEAASVISTLAGNVDLVRREQENANVAFTEGTSIVNEFGVKNDTVQARLEKLQKGFLDVRVELGERLLPVMRYMVSTGSLTVKGLKAVVDALTEHKGVILTTAAAIGVYTVAVNRSIIADKMKVLWTGRISTAMKGVTKVLKSNPWGIAITVLSTVVGGLIDLKRKHDAVTESMQSLERVNKNASDEYERQAERVEVLTAVVHNDNLALNARKKALEDLKGIIPSYNGMLDEEGRLTNDNTDAIKVYLAQLEKEIKLKAAREELEELYRRKRLAERQLNNDEKARDEAQRNLSVAETTSSIRSSRAGTSGTRMLTSGLDQSVKTMRTEFEKAEKVVESTKKELNDIESTIADINKEIESSSLSGTSKKNLQVDSGGDTVVPTSGGGGGGTFDELAAEEAVLKQRLEQAKNAAKESLNVEIKKGVDLEKAQEAYQQTLFDAEKKYLAERIKLWDENKKDTTELQGQFYDILIAESTKAYEKLKAAQEAEKQSEFANAEKEADDKRREAKQDFIDGRIQDEEAYRNRLLQIERAYLEKRRSLLLKYKMDTSDVDDQLLNMEVSQTQGENRQAVRDKQAARQAGFQAIDAATSFDDKNAILQQMYDDDLVSYAEYQDEKNRIAEEQEQYRMQIASDAINAVSQLSSSASQLFSAMESRETQQVTARYDKEIEKARKAGKSTTKLEEEKEAAILAIKKKYADKQFAAQILQIISSTALGIMQCYAQMGPILGTVFAAVVAAQGAMQLATAKAQRDEAKGLKAGGYSRDYIEGYTAHGNPNDTAGVIPVHKNEFVANHEAVANPAVKQFLDVFDLAQKRGTIRMLNTTQILEQVRTRGGRLSGGFSDESAGASRSSASPLPGFTAEQRSQVVLLLEENNRLLQVLTEKELIVDPRKMRDSINRVNQLERNVSR